MQQISEKSFDIRGNPIFTRDLIAKMDVKQVDFNSTRGTRRRAIRIVIASLYRTAVASRTRLKRKEGDKIKKKTKS
ncbi:hypothetical protein TNCV_816061 [Trichonephila clavipes]|nr:hypothetical protein TNCV_816061 [Trichonephila clavipes]